MSKGNDWYLNPAGVRKSDISGFNRHPVEVRNSETDWAINNMPGLHFIGTMSSGRCRSIRLVVTLERALSFPSPPLLMYAVSFFCTQICT